jgi:hypothetical protein
VSDIGIRDVVYGWLQGGYKCYVLQRECNRFVTFDDPIITIRIQLKKNPKNFRKPLDILVYICYNEYNKTKEVAIHMSRESIIKDLDRSRHMIDVMIRLDPEKAKYSQGIRYIARYKAMITGIEATFSRDLVGVLKEKDLKLLLDYVADARRSIKNDDFINNQDIEKLHTRALENMDDIIYMTKCLLNKGGN